MKLGRVGIIFVNEGGSVKTEPLSFSERAVVLRHLMLFIVRLTINGNAFVL